MRPRTDRIEAAGLELLIARGRAAIVGDDPAMIASVATAFAGAYLGFRSAGLSRKAHAVARLASRLAIQWGDRQAEMRVAHRRRRATS